jgi:ComF family protein
VPLCQQCLDSLRPIAGRRCEICSAELPGAGAETVCPGCVAEPPEYRRAAVFGRFDGALRDCVHLLKYDRVRPVAKVLGRLLAGLVHDLIPQPWPERVLVTAVPLHRRKRRQRGFNQSELIARQMVRSCGASALQLEPSLLERKRYTESQTGLSRDQRRANVRGAFRVPQRTKAKVAGSHILLVDDVLTTGTTVGECARVLRRAGAEAVYVAAVARALHRESSLTAWAQGNERDENLAMGGATLGA